jgi:1,4-dihydroxy-2-naphthoate octaprenyltransferase
MLFLELSSNVSSVNAIFFGFWLLPFGVVIKSGFIPRFLGLLLIIAGFSYLVGSLNFILSPPYSNVISGITTVGYFGELGVVGWLAVQAAKVQFGGRRSS